MAGGTPPFMHRPRPPPHASAGLPVALIRKACRRSTMARGAPPPKARVCFPPVCPRGKAASAAAVHANVAAILEANGNDFDVARENDLGPAMLDRLSLNEQRIEAMAKGLEEISALPDPVGRELARWTRPNGLNIARVTTPIGVLAIIYESRPNVTADAGVLCLKSGNAVILRGGSESMHSSAAIHAALVEGLRKARLPEAA